MNDCGHTAVVNVGEGGGTGGGYLCCRGGEALLNMGLLKLYSSCFLAQVSRGGILYHGP